LAYILDFWRAYGNEVGHPSRTVNPRAFISLWLVGWLLGEVWAIYSWLWAAFGKEIVTIKEGSLNVRRDVGEFAG